MPDWVILWDMFIPQLMSISSLRMFIFQNNMNKFPGAEQSLLNGVHACTPAHSSNTDKMAITLVSSLGYF